MNHTRVINTTGIGLAKSPNDKIADIRVYEEGGSIQFWVVLRLGGDRPDEFLQYFSPEEAMAFAKAFERLAMMALRNSV